MIALRNMRVRAVAVVVVGLVAAALSIPATIAAQGKVDVTGKWVFAVTTDAGTGEPTLTFKQEGEKLTGHYSSATLGEADLTGTVKGMNIEFRFTANAQGTELPVVYKGTVEGKDAMKGTVDIGGLGSGTFTGKRQ
jgi:hypothetical protein